MFAFSAVLAQVQGYFWQRSFSTWNFGEIVIALIVICAIVGIAIVALRCFEITVSPWLLKILVIVLVAAVAILAIRFLMTL